MIRSVSPEAMEWTDERTVVGLIFPFHKRAHIRELNEAGVLEEYEEEFLPGCTWRMRQARPTPSFVKFTLDHEQSFDHRVGYCRTLDEVDEGVKAEFQLYGGAQLEKVRSMLQTSHTGMSVEFHDTTRNPPSGSLRQRRQVHVSAVTATPIPAYADARVLAVREFDPSAPMPTPNLDAVRRMLKGDG